MSGICSSVFMHVSTKKGTGGRTARFSFFLGTPKSWPGRKGRGFPFHPCVCALLWQQPRYLFPWRPPGRAAWTGPRSSTCIIASDKVNFQNKRFLNPTSTKIHNIFPCNFGWYCNFLRKNTYLKTNSLNLTGESLVPFCFTLLRMYLCAPSANVIHGVEFQSSTIKISLN